MKRRILSLVVALIVCSTSLQVLTAINAGAESVNITPYGSFDTERELLANTSTDWSTTAWIEDESSGGYAKTSATRWWKNTIFAQFPLVPNETYTISADIKSADDTDTISLIDSSNLGNSYTGRTVTKPDDLTITTEWKTFTFTYTNTCALADGTVVTNDYLKFGFRRGIESAGQGKYFYVDNVTVTPAGNTGYDWNDYINSMWGDMESFDADDGFVPEQAESGDPYMEIYVDGENGEDTNAGTESSPLKTIEAAKEKIQPSLAEMTGHIYVYIKGNINLDETIYWETKDSGQNGYNVIYTAWGEALPEITMKKDFSGFSLYDSEKNIYRTYVGTDINSRQVYINGVRGVRAKTDDLAQSGSILTNASRVSTSERLYYISTDTYLADCERETEIELVYTTLWTNSRVLVDKIYKVGEDRVRIDVNKSSWAANVALSNQTVVGEYPTWIENAYELLDSPGEWYINSEDGYLYYMPRAFETPSTMVATIPVGEQAFVVAGDSTDEKIHNIVFDNLAFKYTTWLYPNKIGLRDEQAMFFNGYKGDGRTTGGTADAALTILDAAYVDVTNCTFAHLGGTGIFYTEVFQKCEVLGNHIYDISASGIVMGHNTRQNKDYLKYYRPTKYKNYLIENKINNNLVHDIGVDYMSAPGITISMLINSEINHNEIYNTNYSGLHVGWGWNVYDYGNVTSNQGNEIMYNYIHDTMQTHLYDGACIYVLGHTGGRNDIAYNYLENHRNGHGALYFDEGSDRWHAYGNVIDLKEISKWATGGVPKWTSNGPYNGTNTENGRIYDNYSTTSSKKGTNFPSDTSLYEDPAVYKNANWPDEAQSIVDNAGLESEYLLKHPDSVQRLRVLSEPTAILIEAEEYLDCVTAKKDGVDFTGGVESIVDTSASDGKYLYSQVSGTGTTDKVNYWEYTFVIEQAGTYKVKTRVGKPWIFRFKSLKVTFGETTMVNSTSQTMGSAVQWGEYEQELTLDAGTYTFRVETGVGTGGNHMLYVDYVSVTPVNEEEDKDFLEDGETMQLNLLAYSRKLSKANLSDGDVVYYSSDESIATVSESGLITAVGHGKCAVYAEYLDGDVIRRKHVNVLTHAPVKEITCDLSTIAILEGDTQDITATGKTIWGGTKTIYPSVTFDDSTIATVQNGILTGVTEGKTVMHATYSADDVTLTKDITVYVSNYNKGDETLTLENSSVKPMLSDDFFKKSLWTGKTEETTAGIKVAGTTHDFMPAYYKNEVGLISFDVTVNDPMSWPSFVVGAEDITKNYKDNCYLISLKKNKVELYKFNNGERTVIFGSDEYERIGGNAYSHSSLYTYGSAFSVTVGTENIDGGTKVVLIINGTPVFDYTDTENNVSGKYFGVYEWNGDFTFSPFTN